RGSIRMPLHVPPFRRRVGAELLDRAVVQGNNPDDFPVRRNIVSHADSKLSITGVQVPVQVAARSGPVCPFAKANRPLQGAGGECVDLNGPVAVVGDKTFVIGGTKRSSIVFSWSSRNSRRFIAA